jgi:hypothetical protein
VSLITSRAVRRRFLSPTLVRLSSNVTSWTFPSSVRNVVDPLPYTNWTGLHASSSMARVYPYR